MALEESLDFDQKLPEYAAHIAGGSETASFVSRLPPLFVDTKYPRPDLEGLVDARTTLDPKSAHGFYFASTQIELPSQARDIVGDEDLFRMLQNQKLCTLEEVLEDPAHPQRLNAQNIIADMSYGIEITAMMIAHQSGISYDIDFEDLCTGDVTGRSSRRPKK
jgi:hypothetical protein